jgi:hypothetical protein
MKSIILKCALLALTVSIVTGCSGTIYNKDKSCSTDYLIIPAISIPGAIDACDSKTN